MWPLKCGNEYRKDELYQLSLAVAETSNVLKTLKIAIDGGKDSLSMYKDKTKSPETLVMSAYVTCPDVTQTLTPELKAAGNKLVYIPLGVMKYGLGGTIFSEVRSQLSHDFPPDIQDWSNLRNVFEWIQSMIALRSDNLEPVIVSGHDISDGGLVTTLCEMSIASSFGLNIHLPGELIDKSKEYESIYRLLFSEEPGLVIEISAYVASKLYIPFCHFYIGEVSTTPCVKITHNEVVIYQKHVNDLQLFWETHSRKCDMLQTNVMCVKSEYDDNKRSEVCWNIPHTLYSHIPFFGKFDSYFNVNGPKIAIIREEGSNGDREMTAAFCMAGFQTFDLTMSELSTNPQWLRFMDGIVFVGGFSYSDCLGAGQGWASVIQNSPNLRLAFDNFRNRTNTFSLGVCNGCQVMSILGWIGKYKFTKNVSGRFESRFPTVRVNDSKSIMFKGLSGMSLGIWCAHGEGQLVLEDNLLPESKNIVLQYTDSTGNPTEIYPHNPNGSPHGITGLCSDDGRHLIMMPHPERSYLNWQLPWTPHDFDLSLKERSPWFLMFQNAYNWCLEQKK
jgi:phosphoribosylformylglycinamidine synthase